MRIEIELRNGQKRIVEVDTDNPTQELVNQIATDIESKMGPLGGERQVQPVERGTPAARPSDPLTALAMRYRKQQTAPAPNTQAELRKRQAVPEQSPEAEKFVAGMRLHKDASAKVLGENHPLSIVRRIREIEERISPSRFGKKGQDYPTEEELQQQAALRGIDAKQGASARAAGKFEVPAKGETQFTTALRAAGRTGASPGDPKSMLRDYEELRQLEQTLSGMVNKKTSHETDVNTLDFTSPEMLGQRMGDLAKGRLTLPFTVKRANVSRETYPQPDARPAAQRVEDMLEESYLTDYGRKPVPQTIKAALGSFKPEPGSIREAALQGAALQAIPRLGLRMAFGEEAADAIEQTDWFKGANEAWAIGKYFIPGVGQAALITEQGVPFIAHTMNEGPIKATETMVVDFVKSLNVLEPGLSWQEALGRLANIAFMVGGAKHGIAKGMGIAENFGVRFDRLDPLARIHAEWSMAKTPEQKWAAAKKLSDLTADYGKSKGGAVSESQFVAVTDAAAYLKAQEQAKKVAMERIDRSGLAAWAAQADKSMGEHWTDSLGLDESVGPIRLPATPDAPDVQKAKMSPEASRDFALIDRGLQAAFREKSANLIARGFPVEIARQAAAEWVERLVDLTPDEPTKATRPEGLPQINEQGARVDPSQPYIPSFERQPRTAEFPVPIKFTRDVAEQILEAAGIPKRDAPNVLIPTDRDAMAQDLARAREVLGLDITDLDIEAMVELHVQLGVVRQSLADSLSGEDYLSLVQELELVRTPEEFDTRKPSEVTRHLLDQMEKGQREATIGEPKPARAEIKLVEDKAFVEQVRVAMQEHPEWGPQKIADHLGVDRDRVMVAKLDLAALHDDALMREFEEKGLAASPEAIDIAKRRAHDEEALLLQDYYEGNISDGVFEARKAEVEAKIAAFDLPSRDSSIADSSPGRAPAPLNREGRSELFNRQKPKGSGMVDLGPDSRVEGLPRNVKELMDEASQRPEALNPWSDSFDYELAGNILDASGRPRQAIGQLSDAIHELGGQYDREAESSGLNQFHASGDAEAVARRYRVNIIKASKQWGTKTTAHKTKRGKMVTTPVAMGGSVDYALELLGRNQLGTKSTTADSFNRDEARTEMAAELASFDQDGGTYTSKQDYTDVKTGIKGKVRKQTAEEVILETGSVPADIWNAWVNANSALIAEYAYGFDPNNYEPGSIKKKIAAEAKARNEKAKADREAAAKTKAEYEAEQEKKAEKAEGEGKGDMAMEPGQSPEAQPQTSLGIPYDAETSTVDLTSEIEKSQESLSAKRPNKATAGREIARLEDLGLDMSAAREALDEYEGIVRSDYGDDPEGYASGREEAYNNMIEAIAEADPAAEYDPMLHGDIPEEAAPTPSPEKESTFSDTVKDSEVERYERFRGVTVEELGLSIQDANRAAVFDGMDIDRAVERAFRERQEKGESIPIDKYIKATEVTMNGQTHYSIGTAMEKLARTKRIAAKKAAAAEFSKHPDYISIAGEKGLLPARMREYWQSLYDEHSKHWPNMGRALAKEERAKFAARVSAEIERYDGKVLWDDIVNAHQELLWEDDSAGAEAMQPILDTYRGKGGTVELTPQDAATLKELLGKSTNDSSLRLLYKARHRAEFLDAYEPPKAAPDAVPPMGQKSTPDIDYRRIVLTKGDTVASIVKQIAQARFAQSPARERVPLLARYGDASTVGDAFVRYIKAGEAPIPDLDDLMGYLAERVGDRIAKADVPPEVKTMFDEWLVDRAQIERARKHKARQEAEAKKAAEAEAARLEQERLAREAALEDAKAKLAQDRTIAAAKAKLDELEAAGYDVSAQRAKLAAAEAAMRGPEDGDGAPEGDLAMAAPDGPIEPTGPGDDFWNDFLSGLDDLKPKDETSNETKPTTTDGAGEQPGTRPEDSPGVSPPPSTSRDQEPTGASGGAGGNGGGAGSGRFTREREFTHPGIHVAREEVTHRVSTEGIPSRLVEFLDDHQQQGVAKAIARTIGAASPKANPDTVQLVPVRKPDGSIKRDMFGRPELEEKRINKAASRSGGFLNQGGTGVGKTRQVMATAQAHLEAGHKAVVVGPKATLGIDKKWTEISGSYADDSKLMGVDVQLWKPGSKIDPKRVTLTTFEYLKDLKGYVDENTFLVFDEAHGLKNADSQRANHAMPLIDTAQSVMFMTATPVDKINHLHYLQRAGILGDGEFSDMMEALGMRPARGGFGAGTTWVADPRISKQKRLIALDRIFQDITNQGASIKQEIRMDGFKVKYNYVDIPPEGINALQFIEREMTEAGESGANVKMTLRRQLEPYKVDLTMKRTEEHLARGRKVVIFVQRVKNSAATVSDGMGGRIPIWETDGTARMIAAELKKRGIKFAEIHGEAAENAVTSMDQFQAGEADVLVATLESGGTGINLDDRSGKAPRTMIVVTSPFTAVTAMQAIGRIWRMTTKSWAEAEFIVGKGIDVDKWNIDIIANKFEILGAAVSGHAAKKMHPHEIEFEDIDYVRDFDSAMPYGGDVDRVSIGQAFVQVDPIPRTGNVTFADVREDMGRIEKILNRKITYAPKMRGKKLGFYRPGDTGSRIRTMSLRTAFHEVFGHALDDQYGLVKKWNTARAKSPFDDELWQFGQFTSLKSYSLRQKRMEGVAEYMHAWTLNPKATEAAAPMFTAHFKKTVPADVIQAMREMGDHVREWASGRPDQIIEEHINFFGREKRSFIRALGDLFTFHSDGLYHTPAWIEHFGQYLLDDLGAVEHAMRATIERVGLKRYGEKSDPGDPLLLPDEDPISGMRQLAYSQTRLEDILANGVRDARGNRVTGGLGWVLEPLDATSLPAMQADFKDAMVLMNAMRQVEISFNNTKKTQALIDPIQDQIDLLADERQTLLLSGADPKSPQVKQINSQIKTLSVKITKLKADLKNKDENMTGAGRGIYSDLDIAAETVAMQPRLREAQEKVLLGEADDIFEAFQSMGVDPDTKLKRHLLVANRYQQVGDALLAYMVDRGRLDPETAATIRDENQFYQSFKRVMDDIGEDRDPAQFIALGKVAPGRVKQPIWKRKGSTRPIDDPLVTFLSSIEAIVRETDRNAVLSQWVDLLTVQRGMHSEDTPPIELASIAMQMEGHTRDTVVVYRRGKKEHWKFNSAVANALTTRLGAAVDQKVVDLATTLQTVSRNAIIVSPDFWVRNVIRDPIERVVKTQTGSTLKDQFNRSTPAELQDYAYYGGGIHEGHYLRNARTFYEVQEKAMRELTAKGHILLVPGQNLGNVIEFMKGSERIGRMAEFRSAYRQARQDGLSHQQANIFAFEQSRALLDYAIAGSVMRVVNKFIPFTNANIQGKRRMWQAVRNNPAGLAKRYAAYILAPTLAVYALRMLQGGDEEQAQQPAYMRDMFWTVNVMGLRLTIPRGFETALGAAMVERTLDKLRGDEKAFEGFGQTVKLQAVPFDEGGMLGGPVPGLGEELANYDYFRGRSIVPDWENDLALYKRDTSKASELGKLIQAAIGQDARMIDHWIESQFGGLGRLAKSTSNVLAGRDETEKARLARSLVGITAAPPATNARDVDWVSRQFKLAGLRTNPLKNLIDRYKRAKNDDERAAAGKRLYEAARKLRLAAEKASRRAKTEKQQVEAIKGVLSHSGYDKEEPKRRKQP